MFQSFHLVPTMTALENVALPLELAGEARRLRARRGGARGASASASGCTTTRRSSRAASSSGSRSPAPSSPNPAILVADEPTGNLDENTGESIIDLLFALKRDRGATLVLVTHDLALARRCDRMVRLRSGRVEADAPAAA